MELSTGISRFSALGKEGQLRFLARFGHNLTMAARDTFAPQADGVHAPERLRLLSECQHRVFGHMYDLMTSPERRRPDEAIVSIILDHRDQHVRSQAAWAFEEALERVLSSNTSLERTRER